MKLDRGRAWAMANDLGDDAPDAGALTASILAPDVFVCVEKVILSRCQSSLECYLLHRWLCLMSNVRGKVSRCATRLLCAGLWVARGEDGEKFNKQIERESRKKLLNSFEGGETKRVADGRRYRTDACYGRKLAIMR